LVELESVLRGGGDRSVDSETGAGRPDIPLRRIDLGHAQRPSGFAMPVSGMEQGVGRQGENATIGQLPIPRDVVPAREAVVLPVRGLTIPFADVTLREGDTVVVERLKVQMFTVIGLVNRPNTYPYPSDVQYNLAQVIGLAGGLDRVADPRYAVVYRLKADGNIAQMCFDISKTVHRKDLPSTLEVTIQPGDIVAVEQTLQTRTKEFLSKIFNFSVGAYVPILR
jgi:hypothetical protein